MTWSGEAVWSLRLQYLKLFLAPVIWGGALIAGRVISSGMAPLDITFIRFVIASLVLLPIVYFSNGRFPVPSVRQFVLLLAVVFSGIILFNILLFSGLKTVTAARSSVIIAFTPSVVTVISAVFLKERLGLLSFTGVFLSFAGAVITITEGNPASVFSQAPAAGDLYLIGSAGAWALYSISAKYAMKEMAPLTVLAYGSLLGALFLAPFSAGNELLIRLRTMPPGAWWSIMYLSLGSAGLAYLWYYQGIAAVGASKASVFLNLEPVTAIFLGVLLLHETMSPATAAGAVLVILGLVLTNRRQRQQKSSEI